jgi:CubicO group peptidase (beta-lactamase class C family)/D-alanyl-D-alanine dipeptidase
VVLLVLVAGCRTAPADRLLVEPAPGYENVASALERVVDQEMRDKGVPAISVALVVGSTIVWAKGFGVADPDENVPATAETVYRVGSVSKLFTDIGIMKLQEDGKVDLDTPIERYLPGFRPHNPFDRPITLRMLMAHRSGLVREPPVGHYFDPTGPTLAATVESLNRTRLVYEPGTRIKYSNAGVAVAGYVIERLEGRPFAAWLQSQVLAPMGLTRSGFEPTPELTSRLASARMWTYDGRIFTAPSFEPGMAPAGSMYSTVLDLGRFLSVLFARGRVDGRQLLRSATLARMWEPQFAGRDQLEGYGLGFRISNLNGQRRLGHGGAIYGFATELGLLPDSDLGVVVTASLDAANTVTTRVADLGLRLLAASRDGRALPAFDEPAPVPLELARQLDGRFVRVDEPPVDEAESYRRAAQLPPVPGAIEFLVRDDELLLDYLEVKDTVRRFGNTLRVDGRLASEPAISVIDANRVQMGGRLFERAPLERPPDPPAAWSGLIGEYGWDHNVLYIREREGRLHALIEWFFDYPLDRASATEFWFPNYGLYAGERVDFVVDASGRATGVSVGGVLFERRATIDAGETFRIVPLQPVAQLREVALAAQPPPAEPGAREAELVDLVALDETIRLDIRYATTNNFMGAVFYDTPRAFLQRPAAKALVRAHQWLAPLGYGLLIHDAYRPWYVTKMFWDATPEAQRDFVADPSRGSRHNRGCAVDLTLYALATGQPVRMPGGYDELSQRSYPDYPGGTSAERWQRDLLRRAMEAEGFTVNDVEWWHFDFREWAAYPVLNLTFDAIVPPEPERPARRRR